MTIRLDPGSQWIENIRRVISPNCDRRPDSAEISLIVIHGISLPPGQYGGDYIDRLFTNTLDPDAHPYFREIENLRVSAHVLIARNGDMTQYVPFGMRAWHAGESMFDGCPECNDYSIGIELEGTDNEPYEEAQYRKLGALVRVLMENWPSLHRERIAGHCDIAPGRKTDPGPAFDRERFFRELEQGGPARLRNG